MSGGSEARSGVRQIAVKCWLTGRRLTRHNAATRAPSLGDSRKHLILRLAPSGGRHTHYLPPLRAAPHSHTLTLHTSRYHCLLHLCQTWMEIYRIGSVVKQHKWNQSTYYIMGVFLYRTRLIKVFNVFIHLK